MSGESQREIARQEGIDKGTVARILSQTEIKAAIEATRTMLIDALPQTAVALIKAAKEGSVPAQLGHLNGLQVLVSRQKITHDGSVDELLERADVKGRSTQEIAYFIEHGHYPEGPIQ